MEQIEKKDSSDSQKSTFLEKVIKLSSVVIGIALGRYFGLIGILVFITITLIPFCFTEWYIKKGYNYKFVSFLAWSNVITWLFPVLGLFTSVISFTLSTHKKQEAFKYRFLGVIGIILSIISAYIGVKAYNNKPTVELKTSHDSTLNIQNKIAKSVVNILCNNETTGSDSGGSGIIITDNGYILTNAHIIPYDEKQKKVSNIECTVILPDPKTGQPETAYLAQPINFPNIYEKYDLAIMKITGARYSEKHKRAYGEYPREFPSFQDDEQCYKKETQLGESIRIFGYPSLSGGLSLTITEGIVSSFPEKGLIITSAKVSSGNSGGIAVDSHGCMVGIPTWVSSNESEALGVIISKEMVEDFYDEIIKLRKST